MLPRSESPVLCFRVSRLHWGRKSSELRIENGMFVFDGSTNFDREGKQTLNQNEDRNGGATVTDLGRWVGRRESARQIISPEPVAALWATLDRAEPPPATGDSLPPLGHWLYFLPYVRQSELGSDGHPHRGGFLPPVSLPRRMWGGSRITFHRPLAIGVAAKRTSEILSVTPKEGRTGPLVFVTVRHVIGDADGEAITDKQDIVYRDVPKVGASAAAGRPAPDRAEWSRTVDPDPVVLFRYSALTFNGHRIHYDRDYATRDEGYPGLVVHGPLIATLLVDLLRDARPDETLAEFQFRAVGPLFEDESFTVNGHPGDADGAVKLWAAGPDGRLAVEAEARFC